MACRAMARSKEFDPDEALDRAMRVFWRHGYQSTTMGQLVEETGVVRASLYATFGNKAEIFRRALDRYGELQASHVDKSAGPMGMLRQWFENAIKGARSRTVPRGCLLINSTAEYASFDPALQKLIKLHLGMVESFFRRCVQMAAPELDANRAANVLLGANIAIYSLARTGAPERQLRDIAEDALAGVSAAAASGS